MDKTGQHGIAGANGTADFNFERCGKQRLVSRDQDAAIATHGNQDVRDLILGDQVASCRDNGLGGLERTAQGTFQLMDIGLDQVGPGLQASQQQGAVSIEDCLAGTGYQADEIAININRQAFRHAAAEDDVITLAGGLADFALHGRKILVTHREAGLVDVCGSPAARLDQLGIQAGSGRYENKVGRDGITLQQSLHMAEVVFAHKADG